jgi:ribonuclease P protein component
MLPKDRRIRRELFKDIINSPQKKAVFRNSVHFTLISIPSSTGKVQVAASVSKKVSKLATLRNRTRRRIYASVVSLINSLEPRLYLIRAKNGAEKLQGVTLNNELKELLYPYIITKV